MDKSLKSPILKAHTLTYLRNVESENKAEGNARIVGVEKHTHPLKRLLNVLILHERKSVDDQDEIPERQKYGEIRPDPFQHTSFPDEKQTEKTSDFRGLNVLQICHCHTFLIKYETQRIYLEKRSFCYQHRAINQSTT